MMEDLSIKDLGHLVDLLTRGKNFKDAQLYLYEMQNRLNLAASWLPGCATVYCEPAPVSHPLDGLPLEDSPEQIAAMAAKVEEQSHAGEMPKLSVAETEAVAEASQEGIVYDADGNILAISAQFGERGYDPDAHEKQIRIFCDGTHIEAAHTADVQAGTLKHYKKDGRGRIKTLTMTGKVEIRVGN